MASKPSFARLRDLATASKASLNGKDRATTAPVASDDRSSEGIGTVHAEHPFTASPVEAGPARQANLPERRASILRPAPLPPLHTHGPTTGRFAPASTPGAKTLSNRGPASGLLTNASPAVGGSTDALFAPPMGSNPNLNRSPRWGVIPVAAGSPMQAQDGAASASSLHNPNVNVGAGAESSLVNLPLSARVSCHTIGDGGDAGAAGLKRSLSVREDGTVEIPRFKRKELNLGLVPCGPGRRVAWMALWAWCILWSLAGLVSIWDPLPCDIRPVSLRSQLDS